MLLGMLKGLIHRAHVLCDLKEDLIEELDLLKNVFVSYGYPEHLVLKTLRVMAKGDFEGCVERSATGCGG